MCVVARDWCEVSTTNVQKLDFYPNKGPTVTANTHKPAGRQRVQLGQLQHPRSERSLLDAAATMAPKSEYGSTPDVEKGGSDEDKPQKWWCFHATRRVMRTILVLIPLLALTAFDVYASYESMTSHAFVDKDYVDNTAILGFRV